jgi:putative DNA primase/helicase
MATNHKPRIKEIDTGIWSRLKLLPFVECFEGREDRTLKATLQAEAPGILAWAVRGCLDWLKNGLAFPDTVLRATAEYRKESDQLGRFIEECGETGEYFTVRARVLFTGYRKWATDTGEPVLSETAFGRRMGSRGVKKDRDGEGTFYQNIRLREIRTDGF